MTQPTITDTIPFQLGQISHPQAGLAIKITALTPTPQLSVRTVVAFRNVETHQHHLALIRGRINDTHVFFLRNSARDELVLLRHQSSGTPSWSPHSAIRQAGFDLAIANQDSSIPIHRELSSDWLANAELVIVENTPIAQFKVPFTLEQPE